MFSNLYEKSKNFIKKYYKDLIFLIVVYLFFMWPVNYYIITGGGIMPVGDRIKVENAYKEKGSLNLAYVTELKGTIATYLLSYVIPDWERVKASQYKYSDDETIEDIEFRGKVDLLSSNYYAVKNAYKEAKKTYITTSNELYIYYIDPNSSNDFKVGDKVLEVEGKKINDVDEYKEIISNHKENDQIKVVVERKKHRKEIIATIKMKDNKLITGIYIYKIEKYKTYPKVEINFKSSESGPSGGLIETLSIYNKLTEKDITKGLKIAGTGEIDENGNIGTIGGVKYKLLGAVKNKADIFLVPNGSNYKTCMKVKKDKNLKIKIIKVSTFSEALEQLNKIN